ncbi:MAG: T9SS type A sorting domain-containing protein [Chitinophagaceae bacterium]
MKKLLLFCSILFMAFQSIGQVTIQHDSVWYNNFPKDGAAHALKDSIHNDTNAPFTITWQKSASHILNGWSIIGMCDKNGCYSGTSTSSFTVVLNPGEMAVFYVDMSAIASAEDGVSWVTLTTSVGDMTFLFKSWPNETVNFNENNFATVYPNPATNFVSVNVNNSNIANMHVVNVIGKRVASLKINPAINNKIRYNMENLNNGIYMLQFTDSKGKLLGVKRITKN